MFDESTRHARASIEENCDKIGTGSRGKINGPKSAQTDSGPNPNTQERGDGLMSTILPAPTDNPAGALQGHALEFLRLTREQGDAFNRNRTYYVQLARQYGITNEIIGNVLGVTEARVRQIAAGV